MGSVSLVHLIIILVIALLFVFPIAKIVSRTGLSGWWALLFFVPVVSVIGLWVLAYARWPAIEKTTAI